MISGLNARIASTTSTTMAIAEPHDATDHRVAALMQRLAMGEGAAELLLEREEEAGCQRERGEPQRRDRVELGVAAER